MDKWLDKVHHGDCLEVMRSMPDECVDLVVTSPPYNLRNTSAHGRGKYDWDQSRLGQFGYDDYEDNLPYGMYVEWQRECLTEMLRLLPPTGAVFYNHKWRVQHGLLQDRREIVEGFPVRQIIIWNRGSGSNFNPGYFVPYFEVIYLIAKPDFRLVDRAWNHGNVWHIGPTTRADHPAVMPLKVAQRCIASTDAQVVLDPFLGSGTTAVAAVQARRSFIGIEKSEQYCMVAWGRIERERLTPGLL